jgi:hypothetical protein
MCSQERREHLRKMGLLLQEFDVDQSGDLNVSEITNLITQHEIRNGRHTPTVPREEEIAWILQAAGKHRENAIDITELDFALKLWDAYVMDRANIENFFSNKADTRQNQLPEFDQLKLYLAKSTGFPPKVLYSMPNFVAFIFRLCVFLLMRRVYQNSDVRAIMQEVIGVDGINLMQLALATSLWCTPPSCLLLLSHIAAYPHLVCNDST